MQMTAYRLASDLIQHGIFHFLKITKIQFYFFGEEVWYSRKGTKFGVRSPIFGNKWLVTRHFLPPQKRIKFLTEM